MNCNKKIEVYSKKSFVTRKRINVIKNVLRDI